MHLLPIAHSNVGAELQSVVSLVDRGEVPFAGMAAVSKLYRQLAVADLLLSGDPAGFYEHLAHSVQVTVHGLQTAPAHELRLSCCHAFFDAVAARNASGAEALIAAAPMEPALRVEYEEEFLYVRIAIAAYRDEDLTPFVERYEALTATQDDLRVPLVRALLDAEPAAWNEALCEYATSLADATEEALTADRCDPDEVVTVGRLSTEILAWIELADRRGVVDAAKLQPIPLAPKIARAFHRSKAPAPDGWKHISGYSL